MLFCYCIFQSICACLVLSVSSSSWCLGWAAACDCGIPWTFILPFLFRVEIRNLLILTLVLLNPDIPCLCKQCRSRQLA